VTGEDELGNEYITSSVWVASTVDKTQESIFGRFGHVLKKEEETEAASYKEVWCKC